MYCPFFSNQYRHAYIGVNFKVTKQKNKQLMYVLFLLLFFLSACGTSDITSQSQGIWEGGILYYFSQIIMRLSDLLGGNPGMGIIVFVLIVRILLLPATHLQTKSMRKVQELNPKLEELKEKYAAKDKETQEKLKKETALLYEKEKVNPYLGCLPMLLQMPLLLALYQTISRTSALRTGTFLWTHLGQPDPYFIWPLLAALFTWWNSRLTTMTNKQQGGALLTYAMPVMILFVSVPLPSALSLYFVVTNAFSVVQTLLLNNPYRMMKEKERNEEAKQQKERERKRALRKAKKTGRNVKR